jgi:2-methylisocitrate lyase-like PEP mutase family enzyme
VRLATEAGVDCIFLTGKAPLDLLRAAHAATSLPFIVNDRNPPPRDELLRLGVRILYEGHQPFFVMIQALHEAYAAQRRGDRESLHQRSLADDVRKPALAEEEYAGSVSDYLG